MCTDQTAVQNDYIEERDRCREYSQLKLDMALKESGGPNDDKTKKALLINLFSECMASHGWTVPDSKGDTKTAAPTPPTPEAAAAQLAAANEKKAFLARASECEFARSAADMSSVSRIRAQACDAECNARTKAAPTGPRPAACPADVKPGVGRNDPTN